MKRSEQIKPLSRDHHFGLLFCWKIKQGLQYNIALSRIQNYVQYYWQNHLRQHFEEEENILFNQLPNICQTAIKEHLLIESDIQKINAGNFTAEDYERFAELVSNHIRYEERTLFPLIESSLEPLLLDKIGKQLNDLHSSPTVDNFEDEFWVKAIP